MGLSAVTEKVAMLTYKLEGLSPCEMGEVKPFKGWRSCDAHGEMAGQPGRVLTYRQ
jgi:hypothetical protein